MKLKTKIEPYRPQQPYNIARQKAIGITFSTTTILRLEFSHLDLTSPNKNELPINWKASMISGHYTKEVQIKLPIILMTYLPGKLYFK